jgi:2-polyprenyl-6-methoxyphenol hydroxylase-like FAD-dependent oxidoreductase
MTMTNGASKHKQAIVIGASLTGLLTARVLADHFDQVTLLERDPVHDVPESRKGQAQTRHIHGLLAQGLIILQEYFPGLDEELCAGGAFKGDLGERIHWYQYGGYRINFKSGITGMAMSRPFLEFHIRRRVLRMPNVTLIDSCAVTELVTSPDKKRVTGVHVMKRSAENIPEILDADLVVDASGRGSSTPKWLESLGYDRPAETEVKTRIGYATREYRRLEQDDQLRSEMILPTGPTEKHGAILFPVEGDRWILTAGGYVGDHPPADEAGLLEYIRTLPVPDIYNIISTAEPLTEIITYKYPASLWRHYEKLKSFPEGFLVIGDALASFNPIYGQGMTSAAMQTHVLKTLLAQSPTRQGFWRPYFKEASRVVNMPWQLAVGEDFRYPETEGRKPPFTDILNTYVAKLHQATHRDPVVYSQFMRVVNLMAAPTSLMSPRILWHVLLKRS